MMVRATLVSMHNPDSDPDFQILAGVSPYQNCLTDISCALKAIRGHPPAQVESLDIAPLFQTLLRRCWDLSPQARPDIGYCIQVLGEATPNVGVSDPVERALSRYRSSGSRRVPVQIRSRIYLSCIRRAVKNAQAPSSLPLFKITVLKAKYLSNCCGPIMNPFMVLRFGKETFRTRRVHALERNPEWYTVFFRFRFNAESCRVLGTKVSTFLGAAIWRESNSLSTIRAHKRKPHCSGKVKSTYVMS
jgi:hypothetical protein